jgi:AraC family transcriptional regulator
MNDATPPRLHVERIRRPDSGERRIQFCDSRRTTILLALANGGRAEKEIDGRSAQSPIVRSAGAAIILPPGIALEGLTSGPVDFLRLSIDRTAVAEAAENGGHGPAPELLPKFQHYDERIWRGGLLLVQELEQDRPGGQLFMDSLSYFFAFHLLDTYSAGKGADSGKSVRVLPFQLKRSLAYIRERLHTDLTLDEISVVSGMSPAHFSRLFNASMGVSPWRYVLHCRLEKGKRFLETSELSIKEIAKLVGFRSATAFITSFGRRYGMPPHAYRLSFRR